MLNRFEGFNRAASVQAKLERPHWSVRLSQLVVDRSTEVGVST